MKLEAGFRPLAEAEFIPALGNQFNETLMASDLFSAGLLAQSAYQTNWLTPVWLYSVGISIGFVLALIMLVKISIGRRIPGVNRIHDNPTTRVIFGVGLSLAYLAIFLGFSYWNAGKDNFFENLGILISVLTPVSLIIGFGAWALVSKRQIGETNSIFREGFLGWLNWFCMAAVVFAVGGYFLSQANGFGILNPVESPNLLIDSLARLPFAGTTEESFVIPPTFEGKPHPIPVSFDGAELKTVAYQANKKVLLMLEETPANPTDIMDLPAAEELTGIFRGGVSSGLFPAAPVDGLYVANLSDSDAKLNLVVQTGPIYSEVKIIPILATIIAGIYILFLCLSTLFPKVFAIAHATFKTEVSQPVYILASLIGFFFIVGSIYIPYNTFGEDIKMYKDSGLTLLRVLAIFVAIWAASKSVAAEIEGRTALTVLSKPVGRRQFIFGKFSGISLALGLFFIVLGFWLMVWVAYKPIYDFKESSKGLAEWTICYGESANMMPGVFLCYLEAVLFVAISVAISTRMGILPNFLICFSIYVLGHLTPLLVQSSSIATLPTVSVFANLIAIVFPVLNHFDVQAAVNANVEVPMVYLGWSIIYTAIYGSMTMLFALVMFEDRDLA